MQAICLVENARESLSQKAYKELTNLRPCTKLLSELVLLLAYT